MTKFLVAVTAMLVLLVVGLVTYNTLDATRTLDRSLKKTKEQIVNEAVDTIRINSAGVANLAEIPGIYDYFNPSFIASYSAGYLQPVYNLIAYLSRPLFNVDAVTVSVNGTQVASSLASDVQPSDVPPPARSRRTQSLEPPGNAARLFRFLRGSHSAARHASHRPAHDDQRPHGRDQRGPEHLHHGT